MLWTWVAAPRAYVCVSVCARACVGGRYLSYFSKIWFQFEEIDESGDGRLNEEEFVHGCEKLGVSITAQARLCPPRTTQHAKVCRALVHD